MINSCIKKLINYGINKKLIKPEDKVYTTNMLLMELRLDSYEEPEVVDDIATPEDLENTLKEILDYALHYGIIEEDSVVLRDLFDTRIMNVLLEKPGSIIKEFWDKYKISPKDATDYYYEFSKASDYIRTYRIKKDMKWVVNTEYGDMDITINLSKPEKDPKMIALAKTVKSTSYPKCLLCMENEGYAGRINHPARQNHRIIPIEINEKKWGFQYSPYVYYNEHCIVFNSEHVPMKIDRDTFIKMFDFIDLFPHYFIGSNADLPIVGGSILSHDHFQGGNYKFAMERASVEEKVSFKGFENIDAGILKWPMSVIRLNADDRESLTEIADKILKCWRSYSDESVYIYAETDGEPHNTITPIARMNSGRYEMDIVLRNNITTEDHPMGLYHPWEEYHNIKKENIGLIEVMGLAVLPSRLKYEMEKLTDAIIEGRDIASDSEIKKHAAWVETFIDKYDNLSSEKFVMNILKTEIGNVLRKVLICAGVFKRNEEGKKAFMRFIDYVNQCR